ncbi:MAG: DUF2254 domain-containing protein [Acidimicrobiia bacterium]|nr:DUF2254 domain-containing protein [Acidimicrobiia bacterium]
MNFTSLLERIRDSQYLIPLTIIILAIGLAIVAGTLDSSTSESPFLLIRASAAAGRTLLTTVAGAIITVAGLVFSLSAITVPACFQSILTTGRPGHRSRSLSTTCGWHCHGNICICHHGIGRNWPDAEQRCVGRLGCNRRRGPRHPRSSVDRGVHRPCHPP